MSSTPSDSPPPLAVLLRAGIPAAIAAFQPDLVYLYGSTVWGPVRPGSDIDLAVWLPDEPAEERTVRLGWLRQAVIARLGFRGVQVADLQDADPAFRVDVIRGLCLYASSDDRRRRFEEGALQEAHDLEAFGQERWEAVTERYRQGLAAPHGALHRDRLERLLFSMAQHLQELGPIAELSRADFAAPHAQLRRYGAAFLLKACYDCVLSISRHLVVALGWGRQGTAKALLDTLEQRGVLRAELAEHLRLIGLMHASLQHPEDGLDFGLLHLIIVENRTTFTQFGQAVVAYLDRIGV